MEELTVTGWYDSEIGRYSDFGIYTDTDGYYHYEEFSADNYMPYYVKTQEGEHYLYLFCEQSQGDDTKFVLKVIDISDGRFTSVGTMNVGPAYISDNIYLVPTDPKQLWVDDLDRELQIALYQVGSIGLPELVVEERGIVFTE